MVVFDSFMVVFEYFVLSDKQMQLMHAKSRIYLKLLAIQLTGQTQITHFESCMFNKDKLIFVGTNRGRATLNISVFDAAELGNPTNWIRIDKQDKVGSHKYLLQKQLVQVLNKPINLESRHNQ